MINNMELRKLLMNLGIHSNLEGYHFILAAIEILSKQKIHTNVTTIYQMIGKDMGKNPSTIERGIRHTIQKCWKNGLLNKIYHRIPNNSAFLYDLYFNFDVIKEEIDRSLKDDR